MDRIFTALGTLARRGAIVELKETEFHTMEEWDAIDAARPLWKRIPEDVVDEVSWRYSKVRHEVRMRWQKLTTGTNTLEWANIDQWLPEALAVRLRLMAKNTPSYPVGYTHESWVHHLNTLAGFLETYAQNMEEYGREDNGVDLQEAKGALHWVADNLEMLWS